MIEHKPFLNPILDLVTLSRLVGTNRPQLSTTLNRQTGMNFSRWLAEYRVHPLLSLVALRPDSDITALASESGFPSRTSFFRQFRQVTGLTPKQYRNVRKETGK